MSIEKDNNRAIENDLVNLIGIDNLPVDDELVIGNPFDQDLEIMIHQSALEGMTKHGAGNLREEVGGIMIGNIYSNADKTYVEITGSIPALEANSSFAHVEFTNQTWEKMELIRASRYPEKCVTGWYHTHPGFGLFMSSDDRSIHANVFKKPGHVALVIDPVHDNFRFFRWQKDEIVPCYTFSIRMEGDMPSKKSLVQMLMIYNNNLIRYLDFEQNCDNLKNSLLLLQRKLSQNSKNEHNYSIGSNFLDVIACINSIKRIAVKEAKSLLKWRDNRTTLTKLNTAKVFDQLPKDAHNVIVHKNSIFYLDQSRYFYHANMDAFKSFQFCDKKIRRVSIDEKGNLFLFKTKKRISYLPESFDNKKILEKIFIKMLPESSLYLEDKKFLKWRIFKNFAIVQDRLYILTSKSVLILEKSALDSSRYDYKTCYSGLSSNFEDLVVDSEYNCYISDSKNNTIVRLNLNGEFKSEISQIAGISINKPTSLCLISEALFVLNSGDRRILKIKLKNNKYEKQFVFHRQFCDMIVKQICADGSGNIYFHAENSLYKILNQESR